MDRLTQRILIIKPSSLGDIVHTLPLLHCLRRSFPGGHIGWIVQQGFASLLERDPAVDVIYPVTIPSTSEPGAGLMVWLRALRASLATLRHLRKTFSTQPYGLVLDLHASLRSALFALVNPGGRRIGFSDAREGNTWFQHERVRVLTPDIHALDKNLLFGLHLGCRAGQEDFYMCCNEQDRQRAAHFLAEQGAGNRPLVYMAPMARWQSKFWPQEQWRELVRLVQAAGMQPVIGGGGNDLAYAQAIQDGCREKVIIGAGRLSLPDTVALMQRCSVYVGLDTGPMHMAAMNGVPVVALFGPTHPERVGPYGVRHKIVRAEQLSCLGCRRRSCPSMVCMKTISAAQVFHAIKECLA